MADTGVHEETLTHIGKRFGAGPPNAQDFIIHKAMTRILNVSTYQYFFSNYQIGPNVGNQISKSCNAPIQPSAKMLINLRCFD